MAADEEPATFEHQGAEHGFHADWVMAVQVAAPVAAGLAAPFITDKLTRRREAEKLTAEEPPRGVVRSGE